MELCKHHKQRMSIRALPPRDGLLLTSVLMSLPISADLNDSISQCPSMPPIGSLAQPALNGYDWHIKVLDNVFEEEPQGFKGCMGDRPSPLYTAAFGLVNNAPLFPLQKVQAKIMPTERGVSWRLCGRQKAATPPIVTPRKRPKESDTGSVCLGDSCHALGLQGTSTEQNAKC